MRGGGIKRATSIALTYVISAAVTAAIIASLVGAHFSETFALVLAVMFFGGIVAFFVFTVLHGLLWGRE